MFDILRALNIARKAHRGQKDKAGKPYILHPVRVALGVKGKKAKVIALLHDVLEDSDKYRIEDLSFLDEKQREALLLLTHDKEVPYFEYVEKIKSNPLAKAVKLSDLKQNSNLKRLRTVTEKDRTRVEKYKKAISILKGEMTGRSL